MQERGRVHELDRGGELDVAGALVVAHAGRGQRQHRPQPFAAGGDEVVCDVGDHRDVGGRARQDRLIDALHVAGDQGEKPRHGRLGRFVFQGDDDAQTQSPSKLYRLR